jgi:hypothetical protein
LRRSARTHLVVAAGLVGALIGAPPAHAVPVGAVPLFEPAVTDSAQMLQPLGATAAGMAWTEAYAEGLWVQPTGGDAALDDSFFFPDVVGDLMSEQSDDETSLTWRTIADPEIHVHVIPEDIDYEARTATGYVGVRGSGPYQVVSVDLLDGDAVTVIGTSTKNLGYVVPSSIGVAAMATNGTYTYFALASASPTYVGKPLTTPSKYLECPWLSRSHLFCYSDTGLSRISLATGAVTSAAVSPMTLLETPTGVVFMDEGVTATFGAPVLKTWLSTAASPTTRVDKTFGLDGSLAPSATAGSVLVGRSGPLGRAGIWSIPLPSGTSSQTLAAPAEPRRASWTAAVAPGVVAWTDNSDLTGNLWTRELDADGTPTGENQLVTDHADSSTLSAAAGRVTYTAIPPDDSEGYTQETRLVDGDRSTTIDEDDDGWAAVLSGDRLLTESMSYFDDDTTWRLRDLRTGTVTTLAAAMDYDLWGERLVRLDGTGRVRLYDLRTGAAPVDLRPATDEWTFGSVHVAGDTVAWDISDPLDWTGMAGDRAVRNVATMAPATQLPDDTVALTDLSTGYVVGISCTNDHDCASKAIALDDQAVTDLGEGFAAVDGSVVAAIDADGMPYVQALPAYSDAPRLMADPKPSELAGVGRTWRARVVTSRVMATCAVDIADAEGTVVRSLDCTDPHAATTVTWDGTGELGDPVPAGPYTWQVSGNAGGEDLVDYDGADVALSGELTVSAVPPPTAATSPADGGRSVLQSANVTAAFSEPAEGVDGSTFQLRGPTGALVPATVTYAAKVGTLNPTADLLPDTTYTATLTGGPSAIRATTNGPLETVSWSFTTGPAPVLTRLTPASNATAASQAGNLSAVFSEPVTGVDPDTFDVTTAGGAAVAGAVTYNGTSRTATFDPSAALLPDTRYTATLTGGAGGIVDAALNPFVTRSWSFTTGPAPTVTGTSPAANATGVGRTANVVAAFSEAVTGVSSTTVKLKTSSGTAVSAVVSYSTTSRKVTINPSKTLAAKTKYTVTLTGGTTAIRDAAGNPLTTRTWSFTTGS